MKHISLEQSIEHGNSEACIVHEYGTNGTSDAAVIEINGRYPETGASLNKVAKAVIHIINGQGELVVDGERSSLAIGDVAFIDPEEVYFFEGDFTMFMSCTPPWSPDQYESAE